MSLQRYWFDFAWHRNPQDMPIWHRLPVLLVRRIWVIARDLTAGELSLHAQSLVYVTLLSLVPLLAVSFSMLKSFGAHNQIEPFLFQLLAPLGDKGQEVTNQILTFVENLKVGVLGALGLGLLLWTVVMLLQRIERALNAVWRVRKQRKLGESFTDYFSVIVIGPVLVFSAIGLMGTFMSSEAVQTLIEIEPLGHLFKLATQLVPYLLIVAAFTFVYSFVPNTEVHFGPALLGAAVAGLLWQIAGWGFASFVVSSGKYTAIYSAFATLILFIFWLFLGWLILLVGASLAFYQQHPEHLMPEKTGPSLSNRLREQIALSAIYLICRDFYHGRPSEWDLFRLSRELQVPGNCVITVLDAMGEAKLIIRTEDGVYLPACPLDTTPLHYLIDAIRKVGEGVALNAERLPREATVQALQEALAAARHQALDGYTLKDMALDQLPGLGGHAEQSIVPRIESSANDRAPDWPGTTGRSHIN